MMENYFVVLQLPVSRGFELGSNTKDPKNFLGKAAVAIGNGNARIVSMRNDTGVSDDIIHHTKRETKQKTYILLNLRLGKGEGKSSIFRKAAQCLNSKKSATIIDTTDKFRLVAA